MNIVFVCTGNTCRSPMAEALARSLIEKEHLSGLTVSSAGLAADGSPASRNAVDVMHELGLDLTAHHSRPLTAAVAASADLLAVMTPAHREMLLRAGMPSDKVVVLGGGIPDPYGGSLAVYRETRDALSTAVTSLIHTVMKSC